MTQRRQGFTPIQWLLVVGCVLVALLIMGLVYTYFDDRATLQSAVRETACTLQYARDTPEWRACIQAN